MHSKQDKKYKIKITKTNEVYIINKIKGAKVVLITFLRLFWLKSSKILGCFLKY